MDKELIFDIYEKVSSRSDLDWVEIRDRHNLDCHPDTLRKAGVGIKMAAEAGALSFKDDKDNSYDEIYKAKKQFYDQRREYNKLLIDAARTDNLFDELKRAADRLQELKPLGRFAVVDQLHVMNNEAVLVLSDWHYGMVADNVWNQYNIAIADRRIARLRDKVIEKINLNAVGRLHVVLLGDLVNGSIHNTCRIKASEDTVDQIMHVSERIAELLGELAEYTPEVCVYSTYGNHARTVQNLKDSIHSDNLEKIIPFWLKERLKLNDHIVFMDNNAHEIIRMNVLGHETGAVHGDLDTGKDAALILSKLYEKNFGRSMEYLITGHMHNSFIHEALGIEQIGVGSLCGSDEFAKNKRLFSRPSQTLLIYNEGGLDSIHEINLK